MKSRYAFLDVYRGLIVLLMIEGHAVREFLQPLLQASGSFRVHEIVHGMTGPGFLFGAGITFGISIQRRWEQFCGLTPVLLRRLGKIALLLGLGYALHLPFLSLQKTLSATTPEGWQALTNFDVLQCIGVTLLFLHMIIILVRHQTVFLMILPILSAAVLTLSPALWNADLDSLGYAFSMALQGSGGSVYPLFPSSAFLFAGAFASYEFLKFAEAGREEIFVKRLSIASVVLLTGGLGVFLGDSTTQEHFWQNDPFLMLMKLGVLTLLMSGSWLLMRAVGEGRWNIRWVALFGIESLFLYVIHLVLLYGSVLNPEWHLSSLWKGSLGWVSAVVVSVVFCFLLYVAARGWNVLKLQHSVLFRGIFWWMVLVFGWEFVTRPY